MSAAASSRRREAIGVAALVTLAPLIFLDAAVGIDAPVFVAVAEQIVREPGNPFGFEMVWDPTAPQAALFNRNPPLMSYWLAPWIALLGDREWAMHAALLPFPALAALAFLGVARRLATPGLAPTLLLAATPAFLVLSTTLLLDIPLLACMLAAVYALLRSRESDAARWQWLAGAAAAAAGLTKYVGFSTAPLLAAGVLLLVARPAPALLRTLLPPLLVWGGWGVWTTLLYGSPHFLGSTDVVTDKSFEPDEFWNQLVSTPVYYGAALFFPILLWAFTLFRGLRRTGLALLGLLLGTACAWWVLPDGEPSRRISIGVEESVLAALGFAGAFLLCVDALRPRRWRSDRVDAFLALWLVGLLVFSAFLNWHVNSADALLAAPPLLLLLFRDEGLRPGRRATAACLAVMLPLSLLLAHAEATQANAYRKAAARIAIEIGEQPGARWSVGQWGLQHYLGRVGFTAVEPPMYGRSDLGVDDWVGTARNISQMDVDAHMSRYRLRRSWTWEERSWNPLRTTNPDAGAGFYSHHYGHVPFAWSRLPVEQIQLGRVVAEPPPRAPGAR